MGDPLSSVKLSTWCSSTDFDPATGESYLSFFAFVVDSKDIGGWVGGESGGG